MNIKCEVVSNYVDKYTNELHRAGELVEVSAERYEELKEYILPVKIQNENDKVEQ